MEAKPMIFEVAVLLVGLAALLRDLWLPADDKRSVGQMVAGLLAGAVVVSFWCDLPGDVTAFGGLYVMDGMAWFFKRFFLLAGLLVVLLSLDTTKEFKTGVGEYYALICFALAGMLFAASANDFTVLFVSLELITITFYILVSYRRSVAISLEAGVKYLILGALSSAVLLFGIALVFGVSGTMRFEELREVAGIHTSNPIFLFGMVMVLAGLAFKIAAFPFHLWAPDVYQGAPTSTTAFLAVGSKAAGFALLLRVMFHAVPQLTVEWSNVIVVLSAITILYGNLCAIPQRNLKRLLGYSSISHGGYLLMGVAAASIAGQSAILFYLGGYLFTALAAFAVIALVMGASKSEDISQLAGLNKRSPFLAFAMTLSVVSLAGIPPLAGFFGKFLLIRAAIEGGTSHPGLYCLVGVAIIGVVISMYYYFGIIRAIYWSKTDGPETARIEIPPASGVMIAICVVGMLLIGMFPGLLLSAADAAVETGALIVARQ
ncbi:NADH-quinone oxidoreductase subunit N [Verrucomicrobia bacterium]|nr:NADH-quinone oxidoreductase subunit N [Verrucomicrobiota bacterium]